MVLLYIVFFFNNYRITKINKMILLQTFRKKE